MLQKTDEISYEEKLQKLDSGAANFHALRLLEELQREKNLYPEGNERPESYSTKHLYEKTGGKMFGILVCSDRDGNEVVLKAFSGKYNDHRSIPGWVPHLFDDYKFNAVIEEGNLLIHPLTEAILKETDPERKTQLNSERKTVSHIILEKLYALYEVHNFAGQKASLKEAVSGNSSIPTGTGDCCAPKLLNFAAKNKLTPIGLAEFYMGKPLRNSDKSEGEFYAPCKEKCGLILDFMLKGI